MKTNRKIRGNPMILPAAAALLVYLFIAANIPYTHDDWDWGLPIGIQQLLLANLNSRYVGNGIEVLLTRSPFLKTLAMGLTFTAIPLLMLRLTLLFADEPEQINTEDRMILFFGANILMITVPLAIWQQTLGWVAGFSNFVVSGAALLAYYCILAKILLSPKQEQNKKIITFQSACCLFFGVGMQLLIENMTVYVTAVSLAAFAYDVLRQKRVSPRLLFLMVGNLIGTAIMFSSGMYHVLMDTGTAIDGYRTLSFQTDAGVLPVLFGFARRFLVLYPAHIWTENTVLCCAVLSLLLILQLRRGHSAAGLIWSVIDIALVGYVLEFRFLGEIQLASQWWTNVLTAGMGLLFFLIVLMQLLLLPKEGKKRNFALLFLWVSAPAVLLPMVVLESVGPRSYLASDLILAVFCLILAMPFFKKAGPERRRAALCIMGLCSVIVWGRLCIVYAGIGKTSVLRAEEIKRAQEGERECIVMQAFPYEQFLWIPTPEFGSERVDYFRAFYHIPDSVELWFENWEEDSHE